MQTINNLRAKEVTPATLRSLNTESANRLADKMEREVRIAALHACALRATASGSHYSAARFAAKAAALEVK